MSTAGPSPLRAGAVTFLSFSVLGVLPILPYLSPWFANLPLTQFQSSIVITAIAFYFVGSLKGGFVRKEWYWAGFETLVVGGFAASLAYFVGLTLRSWVS